MKRLFVSLLAGLALLVTPFAASSLTLDQIKVDVLKSLDDAVKWGRDNPLPKEPEVLPEPSPRPVSTWERRQFKTAESGQGKHSRHLYVPSLKATLISGGDRATTGAKTQNYNNEWLKLSFDEKTGTPTLETYLGYWEVTNNKKRPFHPDQQLMILLANGNVFAPAGWTPTAPPSPYAANEWELRGLEPIADMAYELNPLTKTFTPRPDFKYQNGIGFSRGAHNTLYHKVLYADDQRLRIQDLTDGGSIYDIGIVSSGLSAKSAVWIPGTNTYQVYGWDRKAGAKSKAQVWLYDAENKKFEHKVTLDFHMYDDSIPVTVPGMGALLFSGDATLNLKLLPNDKQPATDSVIVGWDFKVKQGPPKPVLPDGANYNPTDGQKFKPNLVGYDPPTDQVWARYTVAVDYNVNAKVLAVYKVPRAEPLPPIAGQLPQPPPPVAETPKADPLPTAPQSSTLSYLPGDLYELPASDIANQVPKQPLIDLGYLEADGVTGTGFNRVSNIYGYSGMAKRGQRVYFYGSGGAGGWGGNGVIYYDILTHETGWEVLPTHSVHVLRQNRKHFLPDDPYTTQGAGHTQSTPCSQMGLSCDNNFFATLTGSNKHYNRDNTPTSPHAYRQFHNINGVLTQIGSANIFYNDSGIANVINEIIDGQWVRKTPIIAHTTTDDHFVVVDERNGNAYIGATNGIYRRLPDNSATKWHSDSNYQHALAPAGIDPVNDLLVRLSEYPNYCYNGTKEKGELVSYDLATGLRTVAQVIGDTAVLDMYGDCSSYQTPANTRKASPMDWIPEWNAFGVLLPDDTFYKLQRIDNKTWQLTAMWSGLGLEALADGNGTRNGYWSRGKYSTELGAFLFFGNPTLPAKALQIREGM